MSVWIAYWVKKNPAVLYTTVAYITVLNFYLVLNAFISLT